MNLPRPRVVANFAITADGKVTTRGHSPTTYTSAADKARLRAIRGRADALMVGAATVAADNMSMGLGEEALRLARIARGRAPEPLRVIVSGSGRMDPRWKVFSNHRSPLVIFAGRMPQSARRLPDFCDLYVFGGGDGVPLGVALAILRRDYGVRKLLCEGGPRLFRSLVGIGALDELFLTIVPRVFGGFSAPTLTGLPGPWISPHASLKIIAARQVADELHCRFVALKKGGKRRERMR